MPSFPKTLRRCHSTVRGLRNSWAPISGFVFLLRGQQRRTLAAIDLGLVHVPAQRRRLHAEVVSDIAIGR